MTQTPRTGRYDINDAFLAHQIYKQDLQIGQKFSSPDQTEWELVNLPPVNSDGYQGALFRSADGRYVLVSRGTDGERADLHANVQMGSGRIPDQHLSQSIFYEQAVKYINDEGSDPTNLKLVGHSLGGALVTLLGAETGLQTVTFNAYGVKPLLPEGTYGNITNHLMWLDPVSEFPRSEFVGSTYAYGVQIGPWIAALALLNPLLNPLVLKRLIDAHSIGTFLLPEIAASEGLLVVVPSYDGPLDAEADAFVRGVAGVLAALTGLAKGSYPSLPDAEGWGAADVLAAFTELARSVYPSMSSADVAVYAGWADLDLFRVPGMPSPLDPICYRDWKTATTWTPPPPRDPLAIDLDGDGLETVGVNTGRPVLFDHNADGLRTATGWVRGDDAWLVLDRDGNGLIDSGRELFGEDTVLRNADGTTRMARNGFDALRYLHANADSVFNAADPAFTQVRLWQDLNQDGISQPAELQTLQQQRITAIMLNPAGGSTALGNGNSIVGRADVLREGTLGSLLAADLQLAQNGFHRDFTDNVALTQQALALPEMGGAGFVRDLREAMSLGTEASQRLVRAVEVFAAATTRDAQLAAMDELLLAWALTARCFEGQAPLSTGPAQRLQNNTPAARILPGPPRSWTSINRDSVCRNA